MVATTHGLSPPDLPSKPDPTMRRVTTVRAQSAAGVTSAMSIVFTSHPPLVVQILLGGDALVGMQRCSIVFLSSIVVSIFAMTPSFVKRTTLPGSISEIASEHCQAVFSLRKASLTPMRTVFEEVHHAPYPPRYLNSSLWLFPWSMGREGQ